MVGLLFWCTNWGLPLPKLGSSTAPTGQSSSRHAGSGEHLRRSPRNANSAEAIGAVRERAKRLARGTFFGPLYANTSLIEPIKELVPAQWSLGPIAIRSQH